MLFCFVFCQIVSKYASAIPRLSFAQQTGSPSPYSRHWFSQRLTNCSNKCHAMLNYCLDGLPRPCLHLVLICIFINLITIEHPHAQNQAQPTFFLFFDNSLHSDAHHNTEHTCLMRLQNHLDSIAFYFNHLILVETSAKHLKRADSLTFYIINMK